MYALREIKEKIIKSKPFMFAQNVSVPEFKVAVALSTEKNSLLVETFLEIVTEMLISSGFLCQTQINYARLVMNEKIAEF